MQLRHLRHALIAAASALTALPALAEITLPGTLCTSDGSVGKSLTGLMVNKETKPNDTTYFHCPIIRTGTGAGSIRIYVNVRINSSNDFECVVRSMSANNVTYAQSTVVFTSAFSGGWDLRDVVVSVPSGHPSVNMRCRVPNVSNDIEAGIASYRIVE